MFRIGYLTTLCEAGELDATVDELVKDLSNMAPLSVAGMKRAINEIARNQLDRDAFKKRAQACFESEDIKEGLSAFHEKRPPRFSGDRPESQNDRPQRSGIEIREDVMAIDRRSFVASTLAAQRSTPRGAFAQMSEYEKSLYEAAKKEGELTWYIAHYTSETSERFGRTFTEKYPGVKVNVVRTTAQVAYQRLSQDIQANVPNCDVFATTDIGHCVSLKQRGLLLSFKPKGVEEIAPVFRNVDKDGQFHTTSATFVSVLHNTNKVKAEDAPKILEGAARSEMDQPGRGRPPGFLRLRRHLDRADEEALRLELFRDARQAQAADRPLDHRHGDDADVGRAHRRGRPGRARLSAGLARQSGRRDHSGGGRGADELADVDHEERAASECVEAVPRVPARQGGGRDRPATNTAARCGPTSIRGPACSRVTEMKLIQPSVDEIVKGIPEVIEQWRDTFGI